MMYRGIISIGVLANAVVEGSGTTIFAVRTVQGLKLDEHVSLGIGVGYERFAQSGFLPVFLDARAYLSDWTAMPFILLEGGYSSAISKNGSIASGGYFFNAGGGVEIPVSGAISLLAELGYEYQVTHESHLSYVYDPLSGLYRLTSNDIKIPYNLLAVKIGIAF